MRAPWEGELGAKSLGSLQVRFAKRIEWRVLSSRRCAARSAAAGSKERGAAATMDQGMRLGCGRAKESVREERGHRAELFGPKPLQKGGPVQ